MIVRSKEHLQPACRDQLLRSVLSEFLMGRPEREKLRRYYENSHPIANRRREKGLPNHCLSHGFARYIVTMAGGYLLGKPVSYQSPEQPEALSALHKAYERTDVSSVDAELARTASIYGRGVEVLFSDKNAHPRTAAVSPEQAFVVYDAGISLKPLFGIRFAEKRTVDHQLQGYRIEMYLPDCVEVYETPQLLCAAYGTPLVTPHFFGGVPMIEYWNGEDEQGDFTSVLSLIDAYDRLESDRVNDKEQFVDALLVITGARLETDEQGRTPAQQLRQDKLLYLPDQEAQASYLARSLPENDVEVLRRALKSDIHKFSLVPDLTDEHFAGNSSGVAMKFKLLGLDHLIRIKERWFREALRERLRRFAHFLGVQGVKPLDVENVQLIFARSLPVNDLEISQTVMNYRGFVPDEMLLSQVPFVQDAALTAARIQSGDERKETTNHE